MDATESTPDAATEERERSNPAPQPEAPHDVAARLGSRGIAVWDGDFYATGLMERLGLAPGGVVRIGLTHYNTVTEIDRFLIELAEIATSAPALTATA